MTKLEALKTLRDLEKLKAAEKENAGKKLSAKLAGQKKKPMDAVLRFGSGARVKVEKSCSTAKVLDMFFDDKGEYICALEWEDSYSWRIFGSYVPYEKLEAIEL